MNGHIVEKERYDFEDQRRMQPREGGLLGAVIGPLTVGVLFGYILAAL